MDSMELNEKLIFALLVSVARIFHMEESQRAVSTLPIDPLKISLPKSLGKPGAKSIDFFTF